jgi:hypothetical protein
MPAKDLEVGSRLPFVILLEFFLILETETFDNWIYYGRLFQLAGKKLMYFLWQINNFSSIWQFNHNGFCPFYHCFLDIVSNPFIQLNRGNADCILC